MIDIKIPLKAKCKLIFIMKICLHFYNVIFHMKRNFRECSYEFMYNTKNESRIGIKTYKILSEPQMTFILIQEQQNYQ